MSVSNAATVPEFGYESMQLRSFPLTFRVVALIAATGWILRLVWAVSPLITGEYSKAIDAFYAAEANQAKELGRQVDPQLRQRIENEMRSSLTWVIVWIGAGLALAILSLRVRHAISMLAASATMYLLGWAVQPAFKSVGFIEGFRLKYQTITSIEDGLVFAAFDIALPVTFLFVLAWAVNRWVVVRRM
jgi:hypothetical protein